MRIFRKSGLVKPGRGKGLSCRLDSQNYWIVVLTLFLRKRKGKIVQKWQRGARKVSTPPLGPVAWGMWDRDACH